MIGPKEIWAWVTVGRERVWKPVHPGHEKSTRYVRGKEASELASALRLLLDIGWRKQVASRSQLDVARRALAGYEMTDSDPS